MKTFSRTLLSLAAAALCLAACEEEADTSFRYENVPLESHDVVLAEQDVVDIAIGLPDGSYRVTSDDPAIVAAEIADGAIRLTAGKIGRTMVLLSDDGLRRARMQVEVKKLYELTLEALPAEQEELRLDNDGTPKELRILTGNGGYTAVSSDPEAVEARIVADPADERVCKLVLRGLSDAEGVTVRVTDAKRKTAAVAVRVTAPIRPILFDVQGPLTGEYRYGQTPAQITFRITSGNGGYRVLTSNAEVVTATLDAQVVTLTVQGDGGATITVTDAAEETHSIDLWVPLNTDDPTPRIAWDGYRACVSTAGASLRESIVTNPKHMYWDQLTDAGTDTYDVTFNGGWSNALECVGAANRKPGLTTTLGGVTTVYNDSNSPIRLQSLLLVKQVMPADGKPRLYYVTFSIADGREGFIVYSWTN
ncbi:hypothetical protein [Alistipes sp.]|uniref:hypothetical protein n=1 Tax=Alistipes sp. TaxID=1872444 RepID=UPI003AEF28BC